MEMHTTIVGNLTADPELRFTPAGVAVVRLSIAHNPRIKSGDEWKDGEPTFVSATAWRTLAENVAESLSKGARVIVTGRLTTERWEKDGAKRERLALAIEGIGPDLTYATAQVRKMTRSNSGPSDDPWTTASTARPASAPADFGDDEPPF